MRTYTIGHPDELAPGALLPRGHLGVPLCMGCDQPAKDGYCPNCEESFDRFDASLQRWRTAVAAARSICAGFVQA